MDPVPAMQLCHNKLVKGGNLYFIEGADHHLYIDNPKDTVYKLLLDVIGEEKALAFLGAD